MYSISQLYANSIWLLNSFKLPKSWCATSLGLKPLIVRGSDFTRALVTLTRTETPDG